MKMLSIHALERAQDSECLVLCKSESRGDKEKAMLSQAEKRYIEGLKKLAVRLEKGLLVDEKKINQALGRLQSRHGRIKKYYEVKIEKRSPSVTEKENTSSEVSSEETSSPKTTQKRKNRSTEKPRTLYRLTWNRRDKDYASAEALMGCYVLRTDLLNISAEELWKLYMTLTQAEEAFHALKQTLGLRPIFHQLETRVDGHVWITILAYNLLRFIQFTLETHRDYRSWKTIKRVLSTHCYTTIAVPTKDGHIHRIRKAGIPEMCQQEIYQVFGIEYRSLPCTRSTVVRSSITNG
jgi:transposase